MVAIKLFNYRISAQATDKHLTEVCARQNAATALLDREVASVCDKLKKCTSVLQETDASQLNRSENEKSDSGRKRQSSAKSRDEKNTQESKRRVPKPASKRFCSARRISSSSASTDISNSTETVQCNSDTETIERSHSSGHEVSQRRNNDKLIKENIVKAKETNSNALNDALVSTNLKEKVLHADIKEHSSVLDILKEYPNIKIPTNIFNKNVSPTIKLDKRFVKHYLKYQKIVIKRKLQKQKDTLVNAPAVESPPSEEAPQTETIPTFNDLQNFEKISNTQIEATRIGNIIITKVVPKEITKDVFETKTCLDPEDILNISTKNLKIGNTLIGKVGVTSPSERIDFRLDGGKLHKIGHPNVEISKRNANPTLETSVTPNMLLHKCDICKHEFGDVAQLNKHITEHHECNYCHAKKFSNKHNLKDHMNSCQMSPKLTGNQQNSVERDSDKDSVKSTKKITINNGNVKIGSIFIIKAKESQKSSTPCSNTQQQQVVNANKIVTTKNKLTTTPNFVVESADNTDETTRKIRNKANFDDNTNQIVLQKTKIASNLSDSAIEGVHGMQPKNVKNIMSSTTAACLDATIDAGENHSTHLKSNKSKTNNQEPLMHSHQSLPKESSVTTLSSIYKEAIQKSRKEQNKICPQEESISEGKHNKRSLSAENYVSHNTAETKSANNEIASNFKTRETNGKDRKEKAEHDIKYRTTLKNDTVLPKNVIQCRAKEETTQENHNVPPSAEVAKIIASTSTNERENANAVNCKYCHLKLINKSAKKEHLISCFSYIRKHLPVIRLQKMETDPNIINTYFESFQRASLDAKQTSNKRKRKVKVQASDNAVNDLLSELFSSDSETSNNDSDSDFVAEASDADSEDSFKSCTDMSNTKVRRKNFRKNLRNSDNSLASKNKSTTVQQNLANSSTVNDSLQTYLVKKGIVPRQLVEHSYSFQTSSSLNKKSENRNKPNPKSKDTLTHKAMQQYTPIINNVSDSTATHYALVKYQMILPKPTQTEDSRELSKVTTDSPTSKRIESSGNSRGSANVSHPNSLLQQNGTENSFLFLSKQQYSNVPSSNLLQSYLMQKSSTSQPSQSLIEKENIVKEQNLVKHHTNEQHSVATALSTSKVITLNSSTIQEQTNQTPTLLNNVSNSVASNFIFVQKSSETTFAIPSSASTSTQPNLYNSSTSFLCINNSFVPTSNVFHAQSVQSSVLPFQLVQNNINTSQANPSLCITTPPCINYNIVPTPNIIQVQNVFNNSNQERPPIIQMNDIRNICTTQFVQSTQNTLQAGSYSGYHLNNLFSIPTSVVQLQQPNTAADTAKIIDITSD